MLLEVVERIANKSPKYNRAQVGRRSEQSETELGVMLDFVEGDDGENENSEDIEKETCPVHLRVEPPHGDEAKGGEGISGRARVGAAL